MKKTTCIQLVLITAALASCERPLYQQGPEYSGSYPPEPDSSNSCPMGQSALPPDYYLWYSGLWPNDLYFGYGFNLNGYYAFRYPATIIKAGFGRTGFSKIGSAAHS